MAVTLESPRELRGLEIMSKGDQIRRIDADTYKVKSQNGNGFYQVVRKGNEWTCECPDHAQRQTVCKHIWSVYFSLHLRERVVAQVQPKIESVQPEGCLYCGSESIVKIGMRHNLNGDSQRFLCRGCNRKFVKNDGFEKVKATPKAITIALDSYFKGMSQRKIVEHLRMVEGVKVTQPCVLKWIRKYIELMKPYLDKFTPQVGGVWHADETMVKVRRTEPVQGENYSWAWNLMDHDTRFLLASEVTKHRDIEDAREVLANAKKASGDQSPDFLITDKLGAYRKAIPKEFLTSKQAQTRTVHVKLKNIREGTNNNIIERLHGTQKERLKVMRGLDHDESASKMLDANRIYYNFVRPHSALNGQTPAEKAGIDLGLEGNKWDQLIRKAKLPKVIKVN